MSSIRTRMAASALSVDDLWLLYVTLCGAVPMFELEAALFDALVLPDIDRLTPEHVMREIETFPRE